MGRKLRDMAGLNRIVKNRKKDKGGPPPTVHSGDDGMSILQRNLFGTDDVSSVRGGGRAQDGANRSCKQMAKDRARGKAGRKANVKRMLKARKR